MNARWHSFASSLPPATVHRPVRFKGGWQERETSWAWPSAMNVTEGLRKSDSEDKSREGHQPVGLETRVVEMVLHGGSGVGNNSIQSPIRDRQH